RQHRCPTTHAALHPLATRAILPHLVTRPDLPTHHDRYRILAITCPFHPPDTRAKMRRDRPALFARACALEDLLHKRRTALGNDPVWLPRFARPLANAQDTLPGNR